MAVIEFLRTLQTEVGPRRAGTEGEKRAQEWLRKRCQDMGLAVELRSFRFIRSENVSRAIQLASMIYILAGLWLSRTVHPWLVAGAILLQLFYFARVHKKVDLRLARAESHNVLAGLRRPFSQYVNDSNKRPTFIICGHYDTPRSMPDWVMKILDTLRVIGPLVSLTMMAFIVYMVAWGMVWAGARFLGFGQGVYRAMGDFWRNVGFWVVLTVLAPIMLLQLLFILDTMLRPKADSPGADDNGSGTALLLELARRLKEKPLENAEVFFAFWGAEERGLFGSRQFVREFDVRLDKEVTYIVNADCVGVGDRLTIHTGQGVVFRRRTDPTTMAMLEEICDELGVAHVRSWESIISGGSSDHAEWVDRGYRRSVSFIRENYKPLSPTARLLAWLLRIPDANQLELRHIHSPRDDLGVVDEQTLEQTVAVAEAYVRRIDESFVT
ncbi:MAG: M28 family metallopeptidase [Anaerolineae bacterium]